MTEYCFFPKKDTHIENSSKKSPLVLKMVVLAAAMSCSVCICSFFLEQMEEPSKLHIMRANLTEKAQFHAVGVNLTDKTRPNLLRVNLTEKNMPDLLTVNLTEKNAINLVRVDLTEKNMSLAVTADLTEVNLPHLVSLNTSELAFSPTLKVNLTDETLPHVMGVNLTEKLSHDPKLSESQLRHFNNNKTRAYGREEHGCMPVSLYAIVSTQRSGSKWFEALLNSHDNIRSHGEIFYTVDRKCNMTVIKTVLDNLYSLNWNVSIFRRKKKSCMAAVGFKWMLNQGILDNHEGIVDYFNHRGVSAILLVRRNHLRRLVSQKANNHDGKVKGLNGAHKAHAEILASYKPKLDVKRLIPALEHMERLASDTLKNFRGTRHMVVYYEDLVQNQTQTMMEVLEFLKVPQRTLISGHVKIHTRPLAQQIENWRAVAKVIKRSKYRRFITVNDYEHLWIICIEISTVLLDVHLDLYYFNLLLDVHSQFLFASLNLRFCLGQLFCCFLKQLSSTKNF
ncbi:hypothetical protein IEQ34_011093 [Dendrobium chrysotoxum]|uniref:Sulfotransferase n=1 Tax=Dendrobium chrysotoxum TaxID=161865 RepID=A0AAV7GYV4_DENCH|nr:hypothetical protein IEQ34_011093 [Dendrobium chrysotoxum]